MRETERRFRPNDITDRERESSIETTEQDTAEYTAIREAFEEKTRIANKLDEERIELVRGRLVESGIKSEEPKNANNAPKRSNHPVFSAVGTGAAFGLAGVGKGIGKIFKSVGQGVSGILTAIERWGDAKLKRHQGKLKIAPLLLFPFSVIAAGGMFLWNKLILSKEARPSWKEEESTNAKKPKIDSGVFSKTQDRRGKKKKRPQQTPKNVNKETSQESIPE